MTQFNRDLCCIAVRMLRRLCGVGRRAVRAAFVPEDCSSRTSSFAKGATFGDFNHDGAMDVVSGPYWYAGPKFTERHEYLRAEAVRHHRLLGQLLRVHARRERRRLDRHPHHRLPRRGVVVVRQSAGQAGALGAARRCYAGDGQRVADVHRRDRRRPAGTRLQHRRASSATPRFRPTIRRSRGRFTPISPKTRLPAVHARPGRRRRERRRPQRRAGERTAGGSSRRPIRRPRSGTFHDVPVSPTAAARRCSPTTSTATATTTSSPARRPTPTGCRGSRTSASDKRRDHVQRAPDHGREARGERVRRRLLAAARARARRHGPATACRTSSPASASGPTRSTTPARSNRPCCTGSRRSREDGKARFVPHLIDDNSGVGTQVVAGDLNGDKWPDIVVGNKKGTFVFMHEAKDVDRRDVGSGAADADRRRRRATAGRKRASRRRQAGRMDFRRRRPMGAC